ncbi:MAG: helix-turn-helix domain-containing protein [Nitrospira sp.]
MRTYGTGLNPSRFKAPKTAVSMTRAAKILGYSFQTMKRYVDRGYIKGIRKGAGTSIELEEIERFRREGNHLTAAERAARDEQEAAKPVNPPDPSKFIPGKEPDPVEQSSYPDYIRNIPKRGPNE